MTETEIKEIIAERKTSIKKNEIQLARGRNGQMDLRMEKANEVFRRDISLLEWILGE
jgi:hypothetical protein